MCRLLRAADKKALRAPLAQLAMLCLSLAILVSLGRSAHAQDRLLTYFSTNNASAIHEMRLQSDTILDYQMDLFDNGPNPFSYVAVEFSVQKTGFYLFGQNQAPLDTVMLLYKGSFNPNSVKKNLVAANDDWYRFQPDPNKDNMATQYLSYQQPETCSRAALNSIRLGDATLVLSNCGTRARTCPGMYSTLEANERYFMVVTHFRSTDRLTFTLPQSFWCYGGSCTFKTTVTPTDPPQPPAVIPAPTPNPPAPAQDPPRPDTDQSKTDPTTTFLSLIDQEQGLARVMARKAARLAQVVEHDCATYDARGYCFSFRARATLGGTGEGAGVFILSRQIGRALRAGIFIDHVVTVRDPAGFSQPDERPTFGGFVAYQTNPDGHGYELKLSAAYSPGHLMSERAVIIDSEPGIGTAPFTGYAVRADISRPINFSDHAVTPFVSVRHVQVQRGAYSETWANYALDAPLSYADLRLNVTSAVAGLHLEGRFDAYWGYQVSLAGEYDLLRRMNEMSGTSSIQKLETFSIKRSFNKDLVRLSAMTGVFYQFSGSNRVFMQIALRGHPRQVGSVMTLMGYQISF